MDTVIGDSLAELILKNEGVPIFHRFTSLAQRKHWASTYPTAFQSTGVTVEQLDHVRVLAEEGCTRFCIDVAHGHALNVQRAMETIKEYVSKPDIIVGNVCTPEAYRDLVDWGATAVKVGIGPGAACTTRVVTGVGVPQFSAIYAIGRVAGHVPIIADGGIRGTRDACLALAAGASTVMMGRVFAGTTESSAKTSVDADGKVWCEYRGQASAEFQREFYGPRTGTVPEGVMFKIPQTGNAQAVIDDYNAALRSSMSYCGASNLLTFRNHAKFFRATSSYIAESNPRPL
jgi:IMP dehydrogenase